MYYLKTFHSKLIGGPFIDNPHEASRYNVRILLICQYLTWQTTQDYNEMFIYSMIEHVKEIYLSVTVV
jgi:hypothetical protein